MSPPWPRLRGERHPGGPRRPGTYPRTELRGDHDQARVGPHPLLHPAVLPSSKGEAAALSTTEQRLEDAGMNDEAPGAHWHALDPDEALKRLDSSTEGLTGEEATRRLQETGLNSLLGFFQEWRAEGALAALREMAAPHARVLRDGRPAEIEAAHVAPGDALLLETG